MFNDFRFLISMLTAGVLSILATTGSFMIMKDIFKGMERWSDVFFYPVALVLLSIAFILAAAVWWYSSRIMLKLLRVNENL